MKERIEGAMVFDLKTGKFLRRVARRPGPTEYTMSDDGAFAFSPKIKGHKIQVVYDAVGPRVSYLNKRKRMRA